jgi:hypothetical protein
MFKLVATVLQQIMTELNEAESQEVPNIVLKLVKQNGR